MEDQSDWHKESALGWLEEASDVSGGVGSSQGDKLKSAHVHAMLYVGDQIAALREKIGPVIITVPDEEQ